MDLRTPAIVCAARTHGETGVILRVLSEDYGLIASYVAGGRGRTQRPVLLPGNLVAACLNCNQLKGSMLPVEFFTRYPWAGQNFMRYARAAHRSVKRGARRAVSLAFAEAA